MLRRLIIAGVFVVVGLAASNSRALAQPPVPVHSAGSTAKYLDPVGGRKVDELVQLALANNPEVIALRKEAEAAGLLIKQARLWANPSVQVSGTEQIDGTDKSYAVEGGMPLELGGRRTARRRVAERELEIRQQALAERERQLAADVRTKFGETIAAVLKLVFVENTVELASENLQLVSARVGEGRRPPLEESMETVELNRMRAMREMREGDVEVRMFELRNILGMRPEEPLKLRGDLDTLITNVPPQVTAEQKALQSRPDLLGAIAVEALAGARVEQARSEGRIDADVTFGYEWMRTGFHPLLGIDEATKALVPIDQKMNFFTFGVRVNLPVFNRKQGLVGAAKLEEQAAHSRREFGELTIRREVAAAYARYNRAFRAMEIYRVGVRDRAVANLEVVRQTYELGSKSLLDYIGEHHRYIDAENGFLDAQLETYVAMVGILKATNDPQLK